MAALKSRCTTGGGPYCQAVDEIPSAVSAASVRLEHRYDQSGVAVAVVPTLSPWPPRPAGPPVSPELAEALLVEAAAVTPAMTPPKAEDPQQEDVVLPS